MKLLELDGTLGEGGGQILRSALSLAMITGQGFRLSNIRAKRARSGLLRQHLLAVQASAAICGAEVHGAALGAAELTFIPGNIQAGDYEFAVGSAGSVNLVLQTILPALWYAEGESSVGLSGGTHNQAAPTTDFLRDCWLPVVAQMGITMELECLRPGFFPAGGGEVRAKVWGQGASPAWQALDLSERGELHHLNATAMLANLPRHIAERELARLQNRLAKVTPTLNTTLDDCSAHSLGTGNVLSLSMHSAKVHEMCIGFGLKGVRAEQISDKVSKSALVYLNSQAAVGEYLADQLLLPLALAYVGGQCQGRFTASTLSSHFHTNCAVIQRFLPVQWQIEAISANPEHGWRVAVG